jgi:hypothetical protein
MNFGSLTIYMIHRVRVFFGLPQVNPPSFDTLILLLDILIPNPVFGFGLENVQQPAITEIEIGNRQCLAD